MEQNNNPYYGVSIRRITCRDRYIGQQEAFRKLDAHVRNCANTVILGPEGIGKTNFLNCFFNREYCESMAEKERILISRFVYPTALEEQEEIFRSFATAVLAAADNLEDLENETFQRDYQRIHSRAEKKRQEASGAEDYLQQLCGIYRRMDYQVILVIDQFEAFVNSEHVRIEHHNILRQLLVSRQLQMIVATDYDFNQSSLPSNASGSYLLQMFAGYEVVLVPLSLEESGRYLAQIGSEEDFSGEELEALHLLSGGIPALLRRCAYYALEKKRAGELASHWEDVRTEAYEASRPMLGRWLKLLDEREAGLLRMLAEQDGMGVVPEAYREGCLPLLLDRGLVRIVERPYVAALSSVLLWDYCHDFPPQPHAPGEAKEPQPAVINHNQTTIVYNIVPTRELLQMLTASDSREQFAHSLQSYFRRKLSGVQPIEIPGGAVMGEAEFEGYYDRAFEEQISGRIVGEIPVGRDGTIDEISEQEQATLDSRFMRIRREVRPELDDMILSGLSPRAGFYLKLAVIVEDALSILRLLNPDEIDCSAQLVLYGKALEQELRDAFYELFHRDSSLQGYMIPVPGGGKIPFEKAEPEDTGIGTYAHGIGANAERLGILCGSCGLIWDGAEMEAGEWATFWRKTRRMIHSARTIRNLADHAKKESPGFDDVDRIAGLLFGTAPDNIFRRCQLAKQLQSETAGLMQ